MLQVYAAIFTPISIKIIYSTGIYDIDIKELEILKEKSFYLLLFDQRTKVTCN